MHHHKWRQWQPENIVFIFSNKSPPFMSFPSRFFFFFVCVLYHHNTINDYSFDKQEMFFAVYVWEREYYWGTHVRMRKPSKKKTRRRRRMTRQTSSRKAKKNRRGGKDKQLIVILAYILKLPFFVLLLFFNDGLFSSCQWR